MIIYNTEAAAKKASHEEAIKRGCKGVTAYWWSVISNLKGDKWACVGVGNDKYIKSEWFEGVTI